MKARVKKMWEGTIGKYVQPPPWCIYDMLLWCGTKSLTVEVQNSSSVLYFPHSEIPLNCVSRTVFGVSKATQSLALAHVTSESSVSSPDYHTARDPPGLHQVDHTINSSSLYSIYHQRRRYQSGSLSPQRMLQFPFKR